MISTDDCGPSARGAETVQWLSTAEVFVGKKQSEKPDRRKNRDKARKDLALSRLEEKTAHTDGELMGQTRRDTAALSAALQDLVTEAESSSRSALDVLTDRQAQLTQRFEETLAEVERHGLAVQASFARTDDRFEEFLARLETRVAEVGMQLARLEQRLDDVVRQHEENVGRVTAQAIEGISVLERAAAELARVEEETRSEFRQLVECTRTELTRNGPGAQESPSRREMTEQLDDALLARSSEAWQSAASVEQFVVEVQRATARIGALSVRAEAYGEIMRTRLEAIDRWFDGFVDRARGASQLVADVPEFDELVESHHDAGRRTAEVEAQTVEAFRRTTAAVGKLTAQTEAEDPLGDDEPNRTEG